MRTFQVSLAKTYTVNIVAEDEEFYTSDIQDISTEKDRLTENFSIEQIENQTNDAIDCDELSNE